MVLGFLRRRRGGGSPAAQGSPTGPKGQMTPEGYIPTPEELQAAKPLPSFYDGEWELGELGYSDETLGWIVLNPDKWKPKRRALTWHNLKKPVRLNGVDYDAMVWGEDGTIYLTEIITMGLLHYSDGSNTARDVIEKVLNDILEVLDDTHPWRRGLEKGDEEVRKEIQGTIALLYRHLALLKEIGLVA